MGRQLQRTQVKFSRISIFLIHLQILRKKMRGKKIKVVGCIYILDFRKQNGSHSGEKSCDKKSFREYCQ